MVELFLLKIKKLKNNNIYQFAVGDFQLFTYNLKQNDITLHQKPNKLVHLKRNLYNLHIHNDIPFSKFGV